MRKANCMSRLPRNARVLFLVCCPIVLAGCQHPLAPPVAVQQPVRVNHAAVNAETTALVKKTMQFPVPTVKLQTCVLNLGAPNSPKPKDELLAAGVQEQPECLTGQLADGLMLAFKTFTGRH